MLEQLFLFFRRPEEATKQENARFICSSTWSFQHLQLEGSLYTNNRTTRRSSSSRTFTHADNDKQESKPKGDRQMQNVCTMQEPTKIKGKNLPTGANSTSESFEFQETQSLSVQIIAADDQHVAIDFFVHNRSIVTKADEARFAVK